MTATRAGSRPRVLVVSCGGTISSVRLSGATGATPTLDAAALVTSVPELAAHAEVVTEVFSVLPSASMTLGHVLALHTSIEARLCADPTISGVVITHGTDTLEEVAFALDLMWTSERTIVVTGAMRNGSMAGADGPANLLAAVVTAAAPESRGLGVLVVLDDCVHAAAFVRKSHTSSTGTFVSPTVGPIGFVAEGQCAIMAVARRSAPRIPKPDSAETGAVALLGSGLGDDGRLLRYVVDAGFSGLVIEAVGGGHLSAEVAESDALAAVVDAMPVVLSSRVGAGAVLRSTYEFVGAETDLITRGLIPSGVLDGVKSRVLLALLLAGGADRSAVGEMFSRHGAYVRS